MSITSRLAGRAGRPADRSPTSFSSLDGRFQVLSSRFTSLGVYGLYSCADKKDEGILLKVFHVIVEAWNTRYTTQAAYAIAVYVLVIGKYAAFDNSLRFAPVLISMIPIPTVILHIDT